MRVRWAFTYEHDTKPPLTLRGEVEKPDLYGAFKTALFQAEKEKPAGFWRSAVCVVQVLEQATAILVVVAAALLLAACNPLAPTADPCAGHRCATTAPVGTAVPRGTGHAVPRPVGH